MNLTPSLVYDFDKDQAKEFSAISFNNLPNQLEERDPQWYFRNLQYILSFWNSQTANVGYSAYGSAGRGDFVNQDGQVNPVGEMMRNMSYYLGMQSNLDYNHLTPNTAGETTVKWTKGKDIRVGIDNMRGTFQEALSSIKMGANPLSSEIKSKREKKYHEEMFKFLLKPVLEKMLDNAIKGPEAAQDFKMPEQIKEWMESGFKEHLAEVYINIAKYIFTSQYYVEDGVDVITKSSVCGLTGIEHFMDNGYYKKMVHAPYNLIFDNRVDNDFNRYGRFVGAIQPMTLMQVFSRYTDLNEKQRKDLAEIAGDTTLMAAMNSGPVGFPWWNTGTDITTDNKDITFNVVRAYWISPEIVDGEVVEELYSCEVIGNRFMVNFGKCNNVITDPNSPYMPMLPIQLWMPNMTMGVLNSFVGRVRDLQDDYDMYGFKLKELVAQSKGKKFIIKGDTAGGKMLKNILDDFAIGNISVVSSSGIADNPSDRGVMIAPVDLTMDPNVVQLMNIKNATKQELMDYMCQNSATLGRQTKYMGQKSSQTNIDQAGKSTSVFFDDGMNFIQRNIRYGMNVLKNLFVDGQLEELALTVIGEKGLKLLKMTKELYAEDFLIYLKLDDAMDGTMKDRMFEIAKALAQNTQDPYKLTHLITVMKAKTSTELEDKVKAIEKEISDDAQQRAAANMQAQQQMKQAEMQHKAAIAKLDSETKKQGQMLNFIAKKLKLGLDAQGQEDDKLPVADIAQQGDQQPQQQNQEQQPQQVQQ